MEEVFVKRKWLHVLAIFTLYFSVSFLIIYKVSSNIIVPIVTTFLYAALLSGFYYLLIKRDANKVYSSYRTILRGFGFIWAIFWVSNLILISIDPHVLNMVSFKLSLGICLGTLFMSALLMWLLFKVYQQAGTQFMQAIDHYPDKMLDPIYNQHGYDILLEKFKSLSGNSPAITMDSVQAFIEGHFGSVPSFFSALGGYEASCHIMKKVFSRLKKEYGLNEAGFDFGRDNYVLSLIKEELNDESIIFKKASIQEIAFKRTIELIRSSDFGCRKGMIPELPKIVTEYLVETSEGTEVEDKTQGSAISALSLNSG